jgi:hypothetical protein
VAREAVKKLLGEPAIVLKPTDDCTGLEGSVRFRSLGELALEMAGLTRKVGSRHRLPAGEGEPLAPVKSWKSNYGRGDRI